MNYKILRRFYKGHTLIEVLLALAIFSAISASLYSAFRVGILTSKRINSDSAVYEQAKAFLNRAELDLNNVFSYSSDDAKFIGTEHSLDFFSLLDRKKDDIFYPGYCRITYGLGEQGLTRIAYSGPCVLKQGADSENVYENSLFKMDSISFSYAYSVDGLDELYLWQGFWPPGENNFEGKPLPLAVKISISLKGAEFNKVVLLFGGYS